ncbi:MAG: hypothetical protein AVDCRST_MAG19-3697 [uncultured Thermomicrobiales bacterium]|uniref:Uncharacterized protein n=1 Tax=uncultured Thermomicrobiales bacterium TaxID=1645740 RepID=A0A6J4VJW8_9BACT|nr:MAG: hypothetical protein AVDCRST_MAG19-3697 [uncultured Thermomicrobiales bacterium]
MSISLTATATSTFVTVPVPTGPVDDVGRGVVLAGYEAEAARFAAVPWPCRLRLPQFNGGLTAR